jgi:hypothetical protein
MSGTVAAATAAGAADVCQDKHHSSGLEQSCHVTWLVSAKFSWLAAKMCRLHTAAASVSVSVSAADAYITTKLIVSLCLPASADYKLTPMLPSLLPPGFVSCAALQSTLFNAIVENGKAAAANFPFCTIEPNVGIVTVPDPRLSELSRISKSKETVRNCVVTH